ncbi:MAG: class I SAM-dependent methyltransferase [Methylobacteriaceae bacterium]|nr:class I SAM-dependent methyltransferase [Methylobacteriaceae bacterium]
MPSLDWNRRWARKLAGFVPGGSEGQHYGDRWGDPNTHPALMAVRDRFVRPYARPGAVALEIGSGGGRWTQFLAGCARIYCVELNREMFAALTERFPDEPLVFVESGGTDIPGVPPASLDFAFSYGTLVHLELDAIAAYLASLAPLLKRGGQACLHVSDVRRPDGAAKDGFSDNDPARTAALIERAGLVVREIDDATLPHSAMIRAERP